MSGTILIVEDDAVVALDMEEQLRTLGFDAIRICSGGAEVARLPPEYEPDFAIVDLHLHDGLSGPAVVRLLKRRGIACVVVSGMEGAEVLAPGAHGWLRKPYTLEALRRAVHDALAAGERARG